MASVRTPLLSSLSSDRLTGACAAPRAYAGAMDATTQDSTAVSVVLAHADPTVREALKDLVVQALGMRVAGEAADVPTLRERVRAGRPDVVIVAWKLLTADAADVLGELRGLRDATRYVVLGPRPDTRRAAVAAGADAYISMVDAPDVVAATLKTQEPGGSS